MAALPKGPTKATAAAYPMTPTVDANENPTCCNICGRRAWSIGVGSANPKAVLSGDPRYLCGECILIVEHIRKVKRWDVYELQALDYAVEAIGDYVASIGITELSAYDELNQRMLAKAAVQGFGDGMRKVLQEAPF